MNHRGGGGGKKLSRQARGGSNLVAFPFFGIKYLGSGGGS